MPETEVNKRKFLICNSVTKITFLRGFAYSCIFLLSLYLYVNTSESSDLRLHLRIIEKLDQGQLVVPHFLYHLTVCALSRTTHLSFFYSSCLVTAFFIMISLITIEHILRHHIGSKYSDRFLLFTSLALMFVSAIYFPLINKYPYKGVWSPNPWHNPTFIIARPFALLSFYWYVLEIINKTYFEKRFSIMRIAFVLVICALIKPNFILAFIPTSVIICFFFTNRKLLLLGKTVLLLLPVLGILLLQFLFTYCSDAKGDSSLRFCFFDVWQYHAQSVPFALLQGTAFPLIFLIMSSSYINRDKTLFLSWMLFIFGLLIFGFLTETGHRSNHGNFSWTYMCGLNILFIYSAVGLLQWISDVPSKNKAARIKILSCISMFSFHLLSGIYYFGYLLSGHIF